MKKIVSLILALMLTLSLIFVVSCDFGTENNSETPKSSATGGDNDDTQGSQIPAQGLWKDATYRQSTELGEGEKSFTFEIEVEGQTLSLSVKTDEKTVGQALVKLGLIEGEDGAYGLYVKKVNGITADYDTDKTYWAFYINGEYAMTGVDKTDIENGAVYKMTRAK